MAAYQAAGLAVAVSAAVLAAATYLLIGPGPLTALWLGLAVVGASMYLTPEACTGVREALLLLENAFSNIAGLLEALGARGPSLYRSSGGTVYIYVGAAGCPGPAGPPATPITVCGGRPVLVLRSPVSGSMVEGFTEPCAAVGYLLTDLLGLADWLDCVDQGDRLVVEVHGERVAAPASLEDTVGSIYGVVAASAAALLWGSALLEADRRAGPRARRIVVGRPEG